MVEQLRGFLSKFIYLPALISLASVATPQTLRIDGSLFNSAGAPITGSRDIQIQAYDAATGGSAVWTSSVYNTSVASGRFSIALDATADTTSLTTRLATKAASGEIWFEIHYDTGTANGTMDSDVAVAPRIRGKGTMFALVAAKADALTGVTATVAEMNYLSGVTSNLQTQIANSSAGVTAKVSKTGDSMSGALSVGSTVTTTGMITTGSNFDTTLLGAKYKIGAQDVISVGTGYKSGLTLVGVSAGVNIKTANDASTFVGYNSGRSLTGTGGAGRNTMIGAYTGTSGDFLWDQTLVGAYAGQTSAGASNTFLGSYTGPNAVYGYNTLIGAYAGVSLTNGGENTFVGESAGYNTNAGAQNTFLGRSAGMSVATASRVTLVGYGSNGNNSAEYSVGVGASAIVQAASAVQLGRGTNATASSLQFNGYNFLTDSGDATFNSINSTVSSTELGFLDGVTANIQTQLSSASGGGGATYQTTAGSCYSGYTSVDTQTRYMCIQGTSAYTSNSYVSNQACPSAAPTSVGGTAEVSGFWAAQLNTATIRTCRSSATANSCYTTTTGSCDAGFTNVDTITLYSCMTGSSQYTDSVPVESYLSCPSTATTMTGSPSTSGFWSSQLNTTSVKVCCK